ncbi:MAG TPA: indolepyruvate oxidoreductase subunit beta [Syntrophales bacterium]|nr:indolepyruvate oxidoreductase subunit beta [Syntrophales bacterium]
MSDSTRSILLAGVGGQGILRASDIISLALMSAGHDVKKSEVHGMAQRGGCVTSHVRYGKKVYSPISRKGEVDILLSFEKLETLRYLDYLKADGTVIVNEEEIYPPSVNLGLEKYPAGIEKTVGRYFKKVKSVDASRIAEQAGNPRTANTVMIGVLSNCLDLALVVWERVINRAFPDKLVKDNITAFHLGRSA